MLSPDKNMILKWKIFFKKKITITTLSYKIVASIVDYHVLENNAVIIVIW